MAAMDNGDAVDPRLLGIEPDDHSEVQVLTKETFAKLKSMREQSVSLKPEPAVQWTPKIMLSPRPKVPGAYKSRYSEDFFPTYEPSIRPTQLKIPEQTSLPRFSKNLQLPADSDPFPYKTSSSMTILAPLHQSPRSSSIPRQKSSKKLHNPLQLLDVESDGFCDEVDSPNEISRILSEIQYQKAIMIRPSMEDTFQEQYIGHQSALFGSPKVVGTYLSQFQESIAGLTWELKEGIVAMQRDSPKQQLGVLKAITLCNHILRKSRDVPQ